MELEELLWLSLGGVLGVAVTVAVVGLPELLQLLRERWKRQPPRPVRGDRWPPI
jgi:hypothetical protein